MLISNLRNVKNNKHVLRIGDSVIERKQCVKFVGVYIDEHLAWHEHIQACKSKLISALYAICRVKYIVPTESLDALYYSLAYPHLSYGIALWGATYATHMNKLVVLQKTILRALTHAGYNEHTHPLFVKTGILKLNDIYTLEVQSLCINILTIACRKHYLILLYIPIAYTSISRGSITLCVHQNIAYQYHIVVYYAKVLLFGIVYHHPYKMNTAKSFL